MTKRDSLTQSLASTVKDFESKLGGRFESTASESAYSQAASVLGVSQATAAQRIQRLAALELVRLTYEGTEIKSVTVKRDALMRVKLFERKLADRARRSSDLVARLRHACDVGRPSAVLRP